MLFQRLEDQPGEIAHRVAELLFGLRLAFLADGRFGLLQGLAGRLHRLVDRLGLAQIDDRDLALPFGRDEPGDVVRRQPLVLLARALKLKT